MAAPRTTVPHFRLSFGGTLGSTAQEIWSCTYKLVTDTGGSGGNGLAPADTTQAALQAAAAKYKADLSTFHQNYGHSESFLTYIKFNAYGADDLQTSNPTVDLQFAAVAGQGVSVVPWSTALVFEHRTLGKARGFASHGRISYPSPVIISPSTGKVTLAGGDSIGALSTSYATLLSKLNADSPSGAYAVAIVYTSTNGTKPAAASIVDRCFASDIPGEIRRRQNKLRQGNSPVVVAGVD